MVSESDEALSVSAVIPALNASATLERAVASVLMQDYVGPLDVTIAVGPSTDDTVAIADRLASAHAAVSVVVNASGRTPDGLNAAIEASDGDVVVRVDAQSVLPVGYVSRAVETLKETGAANVGGIQRARGDAPFQRAVAAALMSPFGQGGAGFRTGGFSGPTDTVYLGVFDRRALESVGGYNTRYTRNQDYELNWRLREAGHLVWLDEKLQVDYAPRKTAGSLWRQYFQYGWWKARMLRVNPTSVRMRQLVAPALILALAVSVLLLIVGSWLGLIVPTAYVVAVAVASLLAVRHVPARRRLCGLVFPIMHLAWGVGFLASLPTALFGRDGSRPQSL